MFIEISVFMGISLVMTGLKKKINPSSNESYKPRKKSLSIPQKVTCGYSFYATDIFRDW